VARITFAKDLRSAESVLFIAPKRAFDGDLPVVGLDDSARRVLLALAKDLSGANGSAASSIAETRPRWIGAGVLPDEVARYNAPSRPEAIARVTQASGIGTKEKPAIVLVLEDEAHLLPAINAIGRAFPLYSRRSKKEKPERITVVPVDRSGAPIPVPATAQNIMTFAREAALLVDTPPTDMNPAALAKIAKKQLESIDSVKIRQIAGDDLLEERLFGVHAVGRCALDAPRVLVARKKAKKKKSAAPHIALVGKGVTFDTGGLHLKQRGMMETMKSDMGGAAAVLGAFRALAGRGYGGELSLVLCLAENAIGPGAYKPDDILELHSGKTVEINNTDAEGRLLLADGVSFAARDLGAEIVFDAATLTGAQLIATGLMHAAVVTNDDALERMMVEVGRATGDLVHPLPFAPELYQAELQSPVADMRNSVKNRNNAQASCAAQFIFSHIDDTGVKWVHVDLAGPAFRNDRGTGFGVALLVEAVQRASEN
jgi:probable aminopeptidase NPEPL1